MKRIVTIALLALTVLLAGCSSQPQKVERAYTDAEIKEFALEMLSRSGLPYEEYEKLRRAIENPQHRMSKTSRELDALRDNTKRGESRS